MQASDLDFAGPLILTRAQALIAYANAPLEKIPLAVREKWPAEGRHWAPLGEATLTAERLGELDLSDPRGSIR